MRMTVNIKDSYVTAQFLLSISAIDAVNFFNIISFIFRNKLQFLEDDVHYECGDENNDSVINNNYREPLCICV